MTLLYFTQNNNPGKTDMKPTRVLVLVCIAVMLMSIFPANMAATDADNNSSNARTGDTGNEPPTGFKNGDEVIRVYHGNGAVNTHFAVNETIYVNVTTSLFNNKNKPTHSKILLFTYTGQNFWETQTAKNFKLVAESGNNLTYQGSIDTQALTPALSEDHYLLVAELTKSGADPKTFRFYDVIKYGSGGAAQRSSTLWHDSACTKPAVAVGVSETIYLKVYAENNPVQTRSEVRLLNYFDERLVKTLSGLSNNVIQRSASYSIIELDMGVDLPFGNLPGGYSYGEWFTIQVDLYDSTGAPMAANWSVALKVAPMPAISTTEAWPPSVEITTTDKTNITVNFTDLGAVANPDEFKVTIRVRDEANNIISLIEDKYNGDPNVVVAPIVGGGYSAKYTWDPPVTMLEGKYDLYSKITNINEISASHNFDSNQDELTLTTTSVVPAIQTGSVDCIPSSVDCAEAEITKIYANFVDPVKTAKENLEITFKVRAENNTVFTLVNAKGHGGAGEYGGTLNIEETVGFYKASYDWDPPANIGVALGTSQKYDLYVSIRNPNGYANDTFDNNPNELTIFNYGNAPAIDKPTIYAVPKSVDRIGNNPTDFKANFTDLDAHAVSVFDITLIIRHADTNDEIKLLDGANHNEIGEKGGHLTIQEVAGTVPRMYKMNYNWDPSELTPEGDYDISLEVVDNYGKVSKSGFADNLKKLNIFSSISPPVITIGETMAYPEEINRIGTQKTTIYSTFTDSLYKNVTDFNVTFKARNNVSGSEIELVKSKTHNGTAEVGGNLDINKTGDTFNASFEWDPDDTTPVGWYDLYFSVMNRGGVQAVDDFKFNQNRLFINHTDNPPIVIKTNTSCYPAEVEITNMNTTVITTHFSDLDNASIDKFKITFKVRHESGVVYTLAERAGAGTQTQYGGIVYITKDLASGNYTASYEWDPDNDTAEGYYDLFFSVQDETLALIKDDFENNMKELLLTYTIIEPVNVTPEDNLNLSIVDIVHEGDDIYNFTVNYTNTDNLPPNETGVILIIDGIEYEMIEVDSSDTDYTDGKLYYFKAKLEEEQVSYGMRVNDTAGNGIEVPEETYDTEYEDEHDEEHGEEEHDTRWQVILAIILILILLILILVLTRKKKPEEEEME
ncbi:MAG: hypothetical protein JSV49_00650, partial [Thermoplasmata archaeon]